MIFIHTLIFVTILINLLLFLFLFLQRKNKRIIIDCSETIYRFLIYVLSLTIFILCFNIILTFGWKSDYLVDFLSLIVDVSFSIILILFIYIIQTSQSDPTITYSPNSNILFYLFCVQIIMYVISTILLCGFILYRILHYSDS